MVRYRRNFLPGGTYFSTVTLADRRSKALVDHIDVLRGAFRVARRERPFTVDAIVLLPDHLHAILPYHQPMRISPGAGGEIKVISAKR